MYARIWHPSLIAHLEELMRRIVRITRPAPYLAVALVAAACGTGSPTSPAAATSPEATRSQVASAAATPSASPTAEPTPSGSPISFTSTTYGYSLTVPAGWTTIQAAIPWNGKGAPSHDVAEVDQFKSPAVESAWFYGAPTKKDLPAWAKEAIAGVATDHSDTCPPVPEFQDSIKVGAEPGILIGYDCGILINLATAVHDGTGYIFGFRDPAVHAATIGPDRKTFLALLESVKFPD